MELQRAPRGAASTPSAGAKQSKRAHAFAKPTRQRIEHQLAPQDPLPIPATDAFDTDALWRRVRGLDIVRCSSPSFARPTLASKGRLSAMSNPTPPASAADKATQKQGTAVRASTRGRETLKVGSSRIPGPPTSKRTAAKTRLSLVSVPTPPESEANLSAARDSDGLPESSQTGRDTVSTSFSRSRRKYALVTDAEFRDTVLKQHGVTVTDTDGRSRWAKKPYEHFGTTDPSAEDQETVNQHYCDQGRQSLVWLSLDEENAGAVLREYGLMKRLNQSEAKFSFYAKLAFLRQDLMHDPLSEERQQSTFCTMESATKPNPRAHLYPPPKLNSLIPAKPFEWDNKPDLVFWLPLVLFKKDYRGLVCDCTYVLPEAQVAAPYLTVEFKKDNTTEVMAINQVAAAATLALYNRVLLRAERLCANGHNGSWTAKKFDDIEHYGISFTGEIAEIYLATPRISTASTPSASVDAGAYIRSAWNGCDVKRLTRISLNVLENVQALRAWINEIQNWGLGKYLEAFEKDVKLLLSKTQSTVRISEMTDRLSDL